jgi:hypothetical protein
LDGGDSGFDAPADCDLKKDPKDSPTCVVSSVGIFVSEAGLDTNDGTREKPVKTIGKAIAIAGGKPRIYVCAGSYPGVVVDKGVSIYGGFDCTTWAATGAGTLVEAPLNAMTIKTPAAITVADLTLSAKTGPAAGDSSIAALVTSGSNVTFRRVKFVAADGKPGAPGSENTTVLPQATKGPNANGNGGGIFSTACTCADGVTTGGAGGNSPNGAGNTGEPLDGGAGQGGQGGTGDCTLNSNAGFGKKGSAGQTPAAAAGATSSGTVSDTGWLPAKGADGANGTRGQGGGGGGANSGGGGGAGGCGGCGGEKGGGGGGGGASVGLVVNAATVKLESCEVAVATAGAGGKGGAGQKGQVGGLEGKDAVGPGCNGGAGGTGGDGASGGGGAGGISVGILYKGTKPTTDAATDGKITVGTKGNKGIGGVPGTNDGIDGVAQAVLQAP